MQLPFTAAQCYGVFRDYNTTLWPAQLWLLVLAGLAVLLVVRPRSWSGVGVSVISPPACAFAAVVVAGAFDFLWQGVVRPRSVFIVPVLGSLVGVQAALLLSVPQDLALAVVAVVGLVLISRTRSPTAASVASFPTPAPASAPASKPEQAGATP